MRKNLFDDEWASGSDNDENEVEIAISNFFDNQIIVLVSEPGGEGRRCLYVLY